MANTHSTPTQKLLFEIAERARVAGLRIACNADGSINAKVAIVCEAPGENEARMKVPLVGGAGRKLWDEGRAIGLSRQTCWVTNVCKRQVSLSAKAHHLRDPLTPQEFRMWATILDFELCALPNLEHILVLGNIALKAVLQQEGITHWRGSIVEHTLSNGRRVTVTCMNNPAVMFSNPRTEILFKLDMHKFGTVMSGKYRPYNINHIINPTKAQILDYIAYAKNQAIHHNAPIAYDIETPTGELVCIGLAADPHEGMCINFIQNPLTWENRFSLEDERDIWQAINRLLTHPDVRFVAQNGGFDMSWLWFKNHIKPTPIWFDTLLAHHTLYSTLPHDLGFIVTQYTGHPYYKNERLKRRDDLDAYWRYNVKDAVLTLASYQRLHKELIAANLQDFFFKHVMRAQPWLVEMTVEGVLCDTELKEHLAEVLRDRVMQLEEEFYQAVAVATGIPNYRPNPRSPAQLKDLLFKKLALSVRVHPTLRGSVSKQVRETILKSPEITEEVRNVVRRIDDLAKEHKFVSTYVETRLDPDGRFRCSYKQHGTTEAPGRLSSASTGWGTGTNLQNQPLRAQPMFVSDTDCVFGYFDLAQAEARYVGWDAEISSWITQFERARIDGSYDCHRALAAEMYECEYNDVPKEDHDEFGAHTIRFKAKRCRHGLNYRMGPERLELSANLSKAEALSAYLKYHKITPELKIWWDRTVKEFMENRMLINAYGRRLILLERVTDEAMTSIIAFKPQSSIGDKVVRVLYQCRSDSRWPMFARIKLNIHDALIMQAKPKDIKTCLAIAKEHAEEPMIVRNKPLIIPADLKMSYPTRWFFDENNLIQFERSENGLHRWSHMEKVTL